MITPAFFFFLLDDDSESFFILALTSGVLIAPVENLKPVFFFFEDEELDFLVFFPITTLGVSILPSLFPDKNGIPALASMVFLGFFPLIPEFSDSKSSFGVSGPFPDKLRPNPFFFFAEDELEFFDFLPTTSFGLTISLDFPRFTSIFFFFLEEDEEFFFFSDPDKKGSPALASILIPAFFFFAVEEELEFSVFLPKTSLGLISFGF